MTYVARSTRKVMAAAALVLACLSMAAVQPQLAHAGEGCTGWVAPGHYFGCGEEGEDSLVAGGVNAGGGNHHDCVNLFGISGGKLYWPFGWECGIGTIYEEFPLGHGLLYPAYLNSGTAEVKGWVKGF